MTYVTLINQMYNNLTSEPLYYLLEFIFFVNSYLNKSDEWMLVLDTNIKPELLCFLLKDFLDEGSSTLKEK